MPLAILFHFLCAQHVSDINISIIRSLRLYWWITTSVVLFSVRCVLEIWCGWFWVVFVMRAEACTFHWYFQVKLLLLLTNDRILCFVCVCVCGYVCVCVLHAYVTVYMFMSACTSYAFCITGNQKLRQQMSISWTNIGIMTNKTLRKHRPSMATPSATLKSLKMSFILVSERGGGMVLTFKVNFVGSKNVGIHLHIQL